MKLKPTDRDFLLATIKSVLPVEEIVSIILFGSYARNEATAKSDIDVAINVGKPIPTGLWAMIEEKFEESDLLMKVDVIDFQRSSPKFQKLINETGIFL